MEEEELLEEAGSPFWVSTRNAGPTSAILLSARLHVAVFSILAIVLMVFIIPSLVFQIQQFFRPTSVKRGWDSLNLLLVAFAIVCGFLGRKDTEEHSDNEDVVRSPQYSWCSMRSSSLRRASSSYPDLTSQETMWDYEYHQKRPRYYDDSFAVNTDLSPRSSFRSVRSIEDYGSQKSYREMKVGYDVKVIEADSVRMNIAPARPPSPPPPPPPPPPATTSLGARKVSTKLHQNSNHRSRIDDPATIGAEKRSSREYERIGPSIRRDDQERRKVETRSPPPPPPPPPPTTASTGGRKASRKENERVRRRVRKEDQPPPPPPPPPPPLPPPARQECLEEQRSRSSEKKKSTGMTKERRKVETRTSSPPPPPPAPPHPPARQEFLEEQRSRSSEKKRSGGITKDMFSSIYQPSKRKEHKRKKSLESVEPLSPPPPPPPPPPKFFQNMFSSSKKPKSIKKPPPLPPPPPPPPRPPPSIKPKYYDEIGGSDGSESPLIRIPPPPPPPPFKVPSWKFVVQGDYVKISGSPLRETDTTPTASPLLCPSPDVNIKADDFIATFKAKLRLEKINSLNRRYQQGNGLSLPGPDSSPPSI